MSYEVSVIRCADYQETQVREAVLAALEPLGGLAHVVQPGNRVLLKLNLLSAHAPERAVTTHPMLVKVLVQMIQALGATAIIGDSPGGVNTASSYQALLRKTGMQQVIDETGCEVINFDDAITELTPDAARVYKQFTVSRAPIEADVTIALPKLKTHQFAYYTGAVKLLYGYVPGLTKVEYHLHAGKDINTFSELLLDIYESLTPDLCIMDAIVAMEGNGPAHGTPRQLGVLLASHSGTALDYVASSMIGVHPMQVPTVRVAAQRNIGPQTLSEISIHGESLDAVHVPDFHLPETLRVSTIPPWITGISSWLFAPRPVITGNRCVKCGKCAESCPPKAIAFAKGNVPQIDYTPCLRCYCCQELCPVGAIRVGRPRVRVPEWLSALLVPQLAKLERLIRPRSR